MLQTCLDPMRFPREQELSDAETECKGKLKQHHRLPWYAEELHRLPWYAEEHV